MACSGPAGTSVRTSRGVVMVSGQIRAARPDRQRPVRRGSPRAGRRRPGRRRSCPRPPHGRRRAHARASQRPAPVRAHRPARAEQLMASYSVKPPRGVIAAELAPIRGRRSERLRHQLRRRVHMERAPREIGHERPRVLVIQALDVVCAQSDVLLQGDPHEVLESVSTCRRCPKCMQECAWIERSPAADG